MNRSEANEKAKNHISNAGFGTGTNITLHGLKCMLVDFYLENKVKKLNIDHVSKCCDNTLSEQKVIRLLNSCNNLDDAKKLFS